MLILLWPKRNIKTYLLKKKWIVQLIIWYQKTKNIL